MRGGALADAVVRLEAHPLRPKPYMRPGDTLELAAQTYDRMKDSKSALLYLMRSLVRGKESSQVKSSHVSARVLPYNDTTIPRIHHGYTTVILPRIHHLFLFAVSNHRRSSLTPHTV